MDNFNEFGNVNIPEKETGGIISHALELFKNSFWYCLLAVVIYFLLSYVIQIFTGFDSQAFVEEIKEKTESGVSVNYTDIINAPGFVTYSGANFLVSLLLSPIFVSLIYVANKSNFNKSINISDIFFAYRQNFVNVILYSVIGQIALTIAFTLCFVPGFLLMPFFFLGYPIILFENANVVDAIKKSFSIAQENYGTLILTTLLAILISVAGFILCCVGIYLTFPFIYIAMYSAYCAFCGAPRQIEYKP